MKEINIVHIKNQEILRKYIKSISNCFKIVFGSEPWNEAWYCETCKKNYGFESAPPNNVCCEKKIIDYYSDEYTKSIVNDSFFESRSHMRVCLDKGNVVAFYWGRVELGKQLNTDVCREPTESLNGIIDKIKSNFLGIFPSKYIVESEVGVLPDYRGKKLSLCLYNESIDYLKSKNPDILAVFLKTNLDSPLYFLKIKQGYKNIHQIKDSNEVILMLKL